MAAVGLAALVPSLALTQPRTGQDARGIQLLPAMSPSATPARQPPKSKVASDPPPPMPAMTASHATHATVKPIASSSQLVIDAFSAPHWLRGFGHAANLESKLEEAHVSEELAVRLQSVGAGPAPPPVGPATVSQSALVGRIVLLISLSLAVCCFIVVCFLSMGSLFSESTARKLLALTESNTTNGDKTTRPPDASPAAPRAPHKSFFFPDGSHNNYRVDWLFGEQPSGPNETSGEPNDAVAPATAGGGFPDTEAAKSETDVWKSVASAAYQLPSAKAEMDVWKSVASATYPPGAASTSGATSPPPRQGSAVRWQTDGAARSPPGSGSSVPASSEGAASSAAVATCANGAAHAAAGNGAGSSSGGASNDDGSDHDGSSQGSEQGISVI